MYKNVKHFFVKFWGILKHRRRFQEYYSELRSNCGTGEVGRSFWGKDIFERLGKKLCFERLGEVFREEKIFWELERLGEKIYFERLGEVFGKKIFWEVGRKDIIWVVGRSFGGQYIFWEVGRKDIIWEVGRSFGAHYIFWEVGRSFRGKYILSPFVSNSVFLKYRGYDLITVQSLKNELRNLKSKSFNSWF